MNAARKTATPAAPKKRRRRAPPLHLVSRDFWTVAEYVAVSRSGTDIDAVRRWLVKTKAVDRHGGRWMLSRSSLRRAFGAEADRIIAKLVGAYG